MRSIIIAGFFVLFSGSLTVSNAQGHRKMTENLVIITMDGMRWQEIFGGADSALLNAKSYTRGIDEVKKRFWNDDAAQRRKMLFPFFWSTIREKGQLYGNRNIGNLVNVTNPYQFSYPGYNEIFTGYPDTAVNSNDTIWNKNTNVLEFLNRQKGFTGK